MKRTQNGKTESENQSKKIDTKFRNLQKNLLIEKLLIELSFGNLSITLVTMYSKTHQNGSTDGVLLEPLL